MANVNSTTKKQTANASKEPSLFELMQRYNKMAYRSVYNPNRNSPTKEQIKAHTDASIDANREKLGVLRDILRKIEYANKEFFKKLGISVSSLQLNATCSFGQNFRGKNIVALQYHGKNMETGKQGKNQIFLHMNMEKLLQLPAFEVYTLLSAHVIDSIMSQEKLHESMEPERRKELLSYKNMQLEIANQNKLDKATDLFAQYIESFIKSADNVYSDAVTSRTIAIQLIDNMNETEKAAFLQHNFAIFDSQLIDAKRDAMEYRMAGIVLANDEATKISLNKDALKNTINEEVIASNQQFAQMAAIKLQKDFDNLKGNMKNESALRGFCSKFVNEFTTINKMDSIDIRFVNDPSSSDYGAYHDRGSEHWIEVNLANINSITELAATLAHELTHAGDSSLNKKAGNTTEKGRGLLNNISENISGSGFDENSVAYDLLEKVNKSCYYINPNERHARIAEFGAFKIMEEMAVNNPMLRSQLAASLASYEKYIKETVAQVQNIESNIKLYESRLNSLGIPKDSEGYKMILRRINYLKALKSNDNLEKEAKVFKELTGETIESGQASSSAEMKETIQNGRTEHDVKEKENAIEDRMEGTEQEKAARRKEQEEKLAQQKDAQKAMEDEMTELGM